MQKPSDELATVLKHMAAAHSAQAASSKILVSQEFCFVNNIMSSCREALVLGFSPSIAWSLLSVASCRPPAPKKIAGSQCRESKLYNLVTGVLNWMNVLAKYSKKNDECCADASLGGFS